MTRARILADYVAGGTTATEFDVLDGLTSTTAELNYVDGVTSNVQTQLDAKAPLADPDLTGLVQIATDASTEGLEIKSTGNTGQKLMLDSNLSSAADNIAFIQGKWDGTAVAAMSFVTGADTTNKDDGLIAFGTAEAGTIVERMRINSNGVMELYGALAINKPSMGDVATVQHLYSSAGGSGLIFVNFLCGSDKDRVGMYWHNSGIVNTRMWVADDMDLRYSSGTPTSDTSGSVVGSQSFSATHVYKTDATDLKVNEAVKLVDRKLVRCTEAKDPACVGIYLGENGRTVSSFGEICKYSMTEQDGTVTVKNPDSGTAHAVVSLGDTIHSCEGKKSTGFLVDCDVEAGDLLCTGTTAGKLTKQDDDIIHSYTVGKAVEAGNADAPVYGYIYCG